MRKKLRGREPVDWAIEQGRRGAQTGESGQRAWACSQGGRPWGVHSHQEGHAAALWDRLQGPSTPCEAVPAVDTSSGSRPAL